MFLRSNRIGAQAAIWTIVCLGVCSIALFPGNGWAFQEPVSLVSLIAVPEKYDGKVVRVTGYALFGFETSSLFLSPYDAQEYNGLNAIYLDLSKTDESLQKQWFALFDHQTVDVEATFYYPQKHPDGPYGIGTGYPNGLLAGITSVRLHNGHPQMPASRPSK